jgi:hypothetical protein
VIKGPALRAFDAEKSAEDAGDPWGDDKSRWRWCDPNLPGGGTRTPMWHETFVRTLADKCVEAPLAHPRLIRRGERSTSRR